jgi:hypothetical protein
MITKIRNKIKDTFTAIARILFLFLILCIGLDSMTRLYYSYAPISIWMNFRKIEVKMINGEAVAIITRQVKTQSISVFHRTLLIRYPEERTGCTTSQVTIVDDPRESSIVVPLESMLSINCPDVLKGKTVDAVLQATYVFDFPYGVKRLTVRYSDRFSLSHDGHYKVGSPLHVANTR